MADRSARFGTSQSGATGVREQIEHLHRPVRSADLPGHKVPSLPPAPETIPYV